MITEDDNICMLLPFLQMHSKQSDLLIVPVVALYCSLMNQGVVLCKFDLRDDKGFIQRSDGDLYLLVDGSPE